MLEISQRLEDVPGKLGTITSCVESVLNVKNLKGFLPFVTRNQRFTSGRPLDLSDKDGRRSLPQQEEGGVAAPCLRERSGGSVGRPFEVGGAT